MLVDWIFGVMFGIGPVAFGWWLAWRVDVRDRVRKIEDRMGRFECTAIRAIEEAREAKRETAYRRVLEGAVPVEAYRGATCRECGQQIERRRG